MYNHPDSLSDSDNDINNSESIHQPAVTLPNSSSLKSQSPKATINDSDSDSSPVTSPVKPAVSDSSSKKIIPQKRKSIQDQIKDIAEQEQQNRVKIAKINAKEKTVRAKARVAEKGQMALHLKQVRMQFQHDKAEHHRVHELAMIDRQIQLELIKANALHPPPSIDPSL